MGRPDDEQQPTAEELAESERWIEDNKGWIGDLFDDGQG